MASESSTPSGSAVSALGAPATSSAPPPPPPPASRPRCSRTLAAPTPPPAPCRSPPAAHALSAHAIVRDATQQQDVLECACVMLRKMGIHHVTVQIEQREMFEHEPHLHP